MKKLILLITVAFFGCNADPENTKTEPNENDILYACEAYLKSNLKDPDSYERIESKAYQLYTQDIIEVRKLTKDIASGGIKLKKGQRLYVIEIGEKVSCRINPDSKGLIYVIPKDKTKIIESDLIPGAAYGLILKYRAKNSFGGYNIEAATFLLNKNLMVLSAENIPV